MRSLLYAQFGKDLREGYAVLIVVVGPMFQLLLGILAPRPGIEAIQVFVSLRFQSRDGLLVLLALALKKVHQRFQPLTLRLQRVRCFTHGTVPGLSCPSNMILLWSACPRNYR